MSVACRLAVVLLACLAAPVAAQRSYRIERFDATIAVQSNASIAVTEAITVRFTGSYNGIYRLIPVLYRTPQGLNWRLGLDLVSVRDQEGHTLRVEQSRERHYVKYKIWVPGAVDATRTIVLRYRATNGLRFFEDHDELYWNVTGDEWEVPIGAASAVIQLPAAAQGVRAIAFNGVYGSTARDARVEVAGTIVRVTMPHALDFHEGLTAVVGWDKGAVTAPTKVDKAEEFVWSNWPLAIPIPVFLFAFWMWRRRGRDPRRRPITVQYEPPAGLTPGESGTLLDNSVDQRDITATLIDLAVRGYLKIEEQEEKILRLFNKTEYTFHRLTPPQNAAPLQPHEQRMLEGVFAGYGDRVELSQLTNRFYRVLPGIRNAILDGLLARGFYHARPDRVRAHWLTGGCLLGIVIAGLGGAFAAGVLMTPVPFILAGILSAAILLVFALIMPARTEEGTRGLEQVLGFEEFLQRVESETYKHVIAGHPELFDKYLPYAMAFGVERTWSRAFEGIYREPPSWYAGPNVGVFSPTRFSHSIVTLSNAAGSTMTSQPRSSSGSGFGGGGSSGGGGGGGGGGAF